MASPRLAQYMSGYYTRRGKSKQTKKYKFVDGHVFVEAHKVIVKKHTGVMENIKLSFMYVHTQRV